MADYTIKERCAILHRHLVSKGISEKHVRMVMEEVIPLLRTADAALDLYRMNPPMLDTLLQNYDAAWRRVVG